VNIRNTEDDVFNRWRRKDESFVVDGAPNPTAFIASRVKTVIVLKEVNAPKLRGDFDLRHQLENDPDSWWRTVANWCAALSHFEEAQPWAKLQALPIKACLAPFVFMQLKKSVGGGLSDFDTILKYALRDAKEIREQLSIYRPDVIVCAGVGQILASVLGGTVWHHTERGTRFGEVSLHNDRPTYLIDYMHPSARAMKNIVCFGLLDAYREVVKKLASPKDWDQNVR